MLTAVLAFNGARVAIPDAVEVVPGEDKTVSFVSKDGRVLVIFRREDLAMFLRNGDAEQLPLFDAPNGANLS